MAWNDTPIQIAMKRMGIEHLGMRQRYFGSTPHMWLSNRGDINTAHLEDQNRKIADRVRLDRHRARQDMLGAITRQPSIPLLTFDRFAEKKNSIKSRIAEYGLNKTAFTDAMLEQARTASQAEGERIASARDEQRSWSSNIARISRRERMRRNAQKIADAHSAALDRAQQANIQKGIWGAFGGKSQVLGFLKGFGLWYGASSVGRMAKFLAYGNAMTQSKSAQQSYIAAAMTGAPVSDITSYGYALRPYGGGLGEAGSFFKRINQFAQGSLVGKGLGSFGKAALQYGLDITGSGPAGLATRDQLIQRISDRLERMDEREKADFAESLEIDKASFMLMKDGFVKYLERMSSAESGNPYKYGGAENLEKLAEETGRLNAEWDKFKSNIAQSGWIQSFIGGMADKISGTNRVITGRRALETAKSAVGWREPTWTSMGSAANETERSNLYKYILDNGMWSDILSMYEADNKPEALRMNNWMEGYAQSLYRQPIVQPDITFDFSGLSITPEAKQELQQLVFPWLETNVILPLQQTVRP